MRKVSAVPRFVQIARPSLVGLLIALLASCSSPGPPPGAFAVETAVATSNTSVRVTFNRAVGDGGDDAARYRIANPRLRIMAASVDGATVTLTTSAQSDRTYTLEATDIEDAEGDPVDPAASAVVFDGEGLRPSPGDSDGDGLPDDEETRGWTVTVTDENGATRRTEVASDPRNPDTDADGVLDAQERELRLDPRGDDTDEDGLSDFDEIHRYASEPAQRDSDGDSLIDGREVTDIGTSPRLSDTDGDGLSDAEEYRGTGFDALVAEIPELTFEFDSDPLLTLAVDRASSDKTETIEAHLTEHEDKRNRRDSTTTETVVEESHDVHAGIDLSNIAAGFLAPFSGSYDYKHSDTTTTTHTAGWSRDTRDRTKDEYQEFESNAENRTVGGQAGGLTTSLELRNSGERTFTISDIVVGAFILDPDDPTRRRSLTSLEPSGEFPGELRLGPGSVRTVVFEKVPNSKGEGGINSDLTGKLLADPSSLMFQVLSYSITEELGDGSVRHLEQLNETLLARTSFVVIDFGNGDVERHLVATNGPRLLDGSAAGVPMSFVMDSLLDLEGAWETTPNAQGRGTLTMVRNGANDKDFAVQERSEGGFSTWYVYGTSESFDDPSVDFEDIVLKPRDAITLVYLTDADNDGLFAREEFLYGTSDEDADSDDDGLNDLAEVRTGWTVTVAGGDEYQVYADPLAPDSDSDGVDDLAERAAGTDPNRADTDDDGLCDGPGTIGTYTEGCTIDREPLDPRLFQTQLPKLTAGDGEGGDRFGASVAISGAYAIVGSSPPGSAYIVERDYDGSWEVEVDLSSISSSSTPEFGASVAISGAYAIVGDPYPEGGSAHIFKRTGDSWNAIQGLSSNRPDEGSLADRFGASVAISGRHAIVGAPGSPSWDVPGTAYIFERTGDSWSEVAELTTDDGAGPVGFGASVAISGDYAVVGSPREDGYTGAAYVFERRDDGSWARTKLTAGVGDATDPRFGTSVAISETTIVVGAYSDDEGAGSAHIFGRRANGSWTQEAELTPSDGTNVDRAFYGASVAISGDYAVVGAHADDLRRGSAYVFGRRDDGGWAQEAKLTSRARAARDHFGRSVAISGEHIVAGAPQHEDSSGAAYIFVR